ncbi:hypothetical protein PT974_06731 [Cladobotryum mycophilum]|uniref:C6 transcription factor n=1 Tax=Cladobotryum mycophilum TaxID=491253 RepID=A0ABR0SN22_9HYPO
MDEQLIHPPVETDIFMSPTSLSPSDAFSANPRYIELQEELRDLLVAGVSSLDPSKQTTPEPRKDGSGYEAPHRTLDFSRVSIPKMKLITYLKNWVIECAPYLDKFDESRHFGIQVPLMAQSSSALFYAVLAFSARQTERKACLDKSYDSLELYQESIRLLAPGLQAKDPNMLVTACILAVLELMSGSPRNWRRHIEGCASLFAFYDINGFSGGLLQAVFWCYARMELCGAIISGGAESTVLSLDKWVPATPQGIRTSKEKDDFVKSIFYQKSRESADMHANWAVYLCAKACDLMYRRVKHVELGETDMTDDRSFAEQWKGLWGELQFWRDSRPEALLPLMAAETVDGNVFPTILFSHRAAISSNQLYHAACILMLDLKPARELLPPKRARLSGTQEGCVEFRRRTLTRET